MIADYFTKKPEALADCLISQGGMYGIDYLLLVGSFCGYDVFYRNNSLLLSNPEMDAVDARKVARHLVGSGWTQGANVGIIQRSELSRGWNDRDLFYLNVCRVTQEKGVLAGELTRLRDMLESYAAA